MNVTQNSGKTIVYTGGFELPDRNAAAHRVLAVAKMLRDSGHRVVMVGVGRSVGRTPILQTKGSCQGFETYTAAYPNGLTQWPAYLAGIEPLRQVIRAVGGADAVLCYNYPAVAFARLGRVCRRQGGKILADCTEWYNMKEVALPLRPIKGMDTWLRMHVIQKHLDGMIVISRYLEQYYRESRHVVCIPPLVDTTDEKWSCAPKPRGRETTFVYVGNPGHKDRLGQILEAVAEANQMAPCKLWVIGVGWEDFVRLNPEWKKRPPGEWGAFLGRLPHEESLAYLKSADCSFIIRDDTRTNNAGFPTKFVEAVTMGTAVIASNISDLWQYRDRVPGLYLVETDLKSTILQYVEGHAGKRTEKRPQDLFDYRNWMSEIRKLAL